MKNGEAQRKIMDKIMAMDNIEANWDSEEVMEKMKSYV